MKRHLIALAGIAIILSPAAASAQYYGYGPPHHDHGDVRRCQHGDHDDVVVRRHRHGSWDDDRPLVFQRHHDHHHDFDD